MGSCVIGMIALVFVTETAGCSIRGRVIPGVREAELAARA
jgi:hypothetical protein